jgi:hypothetical protein
MSTRFGVLHAYKYRGIKTSFVSTRLDPNLHRVRKNGNKTHHGFDACQAGAATINSSSYLMFISYQIDPSYVYLFRCMSDSS